MRKLFCLWDKNSFDRRVVILVFIQTFFYIIYICTTNQVNAVINFLQCIYQITFCVVTADACESGFWGSAAMGGFAE